MYYNLEVQQGASDQNAQRKAEDRGRGGGGSADRLRGFHSCWRGRRRRYSHRSKRRRGVFDEHMRKV